MPYTGPHAAVLTGHSGDIPYSPGLDSTTAVADAVHAFISKHTAALPFSEEELEEGAAYMAAWRIALQCTKGSSTRTNQQPEGAITVEEVMRAKDWLDDQDLVVSTLDKDTGCLWVR